MSTEPNLYQPPMSDVTPVTGQFATLEDASKGRRLGTFVVDYIGFMIASAVVGVILGLLLGEAVIPLTEGVPGFALGLAVFVCYYVAFEGAFARTPGKFVFGTRVVAESGTPPTFRQVLVRTLCRFIPFEPFSYLGAKGWHDSISKTRVVLARA